jgi:hypothetical protein
MLGEVVCVVMRRDDNIFVKLDPYAREALKNIHVFVWKDIVVYVTHQFTIKIFKGSVAFNVVVKDLVEIGVDIRQLAV